MNQLRLPVGATARGQPKLKPKPSCQRGDTVEVTGSIQSRGSRIRAKSVEDKPAASRSNETDPKRAANVLKSKWNVSGP
ncbi:hypothetical protein GE21DRAFT_1105757 [Neurospora crassa]|nr:hypothetical protein GE21DRAFT_1105757 [Neurospora crassa]